METFLNQLFRPGSRVFLEVSPKQNLSQLISIIQSYSPIPILSITTEKFSNTNFQIVQITPEIISVLASSPGILIMEASAIWNQFTYPTGTGSILAVGSTYHSLEDYQATLSFLGNPTFRYRLAENEFNYQGVPIVLPSFRDWLESFFQTNTGRYVLYSRDRPVLNVPMLWVSSEDNSATRYAQINAFNNSSDRVIVLASNMYGFTPLYNVSGLLLVNASPLPMPLAYDSYIRQIAQWTTFSPFPILFLLNESAVPSYIEMISEIDQKESVPENI